IDDKDSAGSALCSASGKPFKVGLPCIANITLGAIVTGILSGLFGVGGGFIIVPTLVLLTAMTIHQAVATSLFVIAVISSAGFVNFMLSDAVINFSTLGEVAIGSLIGMIAGIPLSKKIAGANLQKIFAVLMLLMALITVITTL
ncbi:MAG: sulfite exporter TauE/SafE family protein, partial [Sinobacterium sp.]|nr:sulfite exporter TauE/SafE family protein [Sinobacterium sp.]